jgi:hypothetical protein
MSAGFDLRRIGGDAFLPKPPRSFLITVNAW